MLHYKKLRPPIVTPEDKNLKMIHDLLLEDMALYIIFPFHYTTNGGKFLERRL
jgi:hypothetical protein